MAHTTSVALIATLVTGALAFAGCGSSDSNTEVQGTEPSVAQINTTARDGKAEGEVPKGAALVLRQIYRQFPSPKPSPTVKGSAKAITAGEAACRGKTSRQVKDAFYAEAIERGSLEPDSPEAKMIAQIGHYAKNSAHDPAFVAGQLAADVYQATLPEAVAQFGYQGCVYSLARGLERELAPGR